MTLAPSGAGPRRAVPGLRRAGLPLRATRLQRHLAQALGAACLLGAVVPSAWAQANPPSATDRAQEALQRQEQERLRREFEAQRSRGETVGGSAATGIAPRTPKGRSDGSCHPIDTLRVLGAERLEAWRRRELDERYTGRCLGAEDIEAALAELTKHHIDQGLIAARAYLPPQDLSSRTLELRVLQGRVDRLIVRDGERGSVNPRAVFPGVEGGVLNLRDLEQGIDQLNRLASNNAKLDVQPGRQPGEATVVVHNQPGKPWQMVASLDNLGAESTGRLQAGLVGNLDNLLGLNELWSLSLRQSLEGRSGRNAGSWALSAVLPWGYHGFSAGVNQSQSDATLTTPGGAALRASSNSRNAFVRADSVVHRDATRRVALAATLTQRRVEVELNGQHIDVSSRSLTVLDLDATWQQRVGQARLSAGLGSSHGLAALGAFRDVAGLPGWAPRAQFDKWRLDLGLTWPFAVSGQRLEWSSRLNGQYSAKVLYGSEQLGVGGYWTVRGHRKNTLAGDRGWVLRNELAWIASQPVAGTPVQWRPFIAWDTGRAENLGPNVPSGQMSGAAIGISATTNTLRAELAYTQPLARPSVLARESGQTWARLSLNF